MTLSFNQMLGTALLLVAGLSFLLRERLLGRDAKGWPHAHLAVRVTCFAVGLVFLGRALMVWFRHEPMDDARLLVCGTLAVYGTVMAANLMLQRKGWPLEPKPPAPGRRNGHGAHEDEDRHIPAEQPSWRH